MPNRSAASGSGAGESGATAAADDDVADIANLALILAALVHPGLPTEQRRVKGNRSLIVRHRERDVIQPYSCPIGRRKWRRHREFRIGGSLPPGAAVAIADL